MRNYTVIGNLKHDGKKHQKGDSIELDETTACPLVELGVLEPAAPESTEDESATATEPAVPESTKDESATATESAVPESTKDESTTATEPKKQTRKRGTSK